jgi:protein-disulfide isomerase
MLKLLITTLILNSFVYAQSASDKVAEFLQDKFSENPRFSSLDVKVSEEIPLKDVKGWNAYIVDVDAILKSSPKKPVKQRMIWFSDGNVITKDLVDMYTGASLIESVKPKFQKSYYKKENLIYGNVDAKHKIALFSDPLCPFCKRFVPNAIKEMKKYPKKFAIYYYHFPLNRIHPASVTLVKAAVAAKLKGYKNIVLNLYNVRVSPRQRDKQKILEAFNKAEGTHLTLKDLNNPAVEKQIKEDFNVANALMVNGTPTLYFDSEIDKTKKKYLKVK